MDNTIEKYKPDGLVSVWRFPESKNYQGLNICFSTEGRHSLIELVDLIFDSTWASKKVINSVSPLELEQSWTTTVGKTKIYNRISIIKTIESTNTFEIVEKGDSVELYFDESKLSEFKQKLIDNAFDRGMETSDLSDRLYFW